MRSAKFWADAARATGERIEDLISEAQAEALAEGRRQALSLDQPWSIPGCLATLADAADHLLQHHNCDCHGHESVAAARDAATVNLRKIAAKPSGEGT